MAPEVVTTQMKAIEQYFPEAVVLFIMLYEVVLTFDSVNEMCDHSIESY